MSLGFFERVPGGVGEYVFDRWWHPVRGSPVTTGAADPSLPRYAPTAQLALQITGESTVACEPFQPILAAKAGSM